MKAFSPLLIEQTVQGWGNGLGLRITSPLAKAAHVVRGTPITVEVVEGGFFVKVLGEPKLTLAQKLSHFDPLLHGGEVMSAGRVGAEVF